MSRYKKGETTWPTEDINKLRSLKRQGAPMTDISKELGRSRQAISSFCRRYAETYNIPFDRRKANHKTDFEREWYGSVPFGHWSITKAWRL